MTSSLDALEVDEKQEIIRIIESKLGSGYNNNDKYLIAIQGATSSGKSTVAKQLDGILKENGINSMLIGLDSYYFSPDNPLDEDDKYDFDNTASLDWSSIVEVLRAIQNNDENLPVYFRRTSKIENNKKEFCANTYPSVIIVEGIYAFNAINHYKLNLDSLDPFNSDKPIELEYINSDHNLSGYKVLKIFLPLCKNKLWEIRKSRDIKLKKPFECIKKRFERMIWPDTLRWVYSTLECNDIQITHGNFNESKMNLLINSLVFFFTNKKLSLKKQIEDDLSVEFKVTCSGECDCLKNSRLILKDNNH